MNSKKVTILSAALISALVAGSSVFADEHADAPAAGAATEHKAAADKDSCAANGNCGAKMGMKDKKPAKAHHGKKHMKKNEKKEQEKTDGAAAEGAEHEHQ